jgi:serine/threonine protein kinase
MSAQHTCTCGHRWQSEGTAPAACPVCGAATASLPDAGATLTFAPGPAPTIALPSAARREGPGAPVEPESVAGYETLGVLGRGGVGVVYKATDLRLKRCVALKMILAGGLASAEELARFKTEAESIARLQHANIVQIYEIGQQQGLPYLALEYCPGGSLHHKLGGTPLPPPEAAALVEQLAHAMQAAHDKGVIHRDLKPANVLFGEDGTPKVTDFGLAKKVDEAGQTHTGAVMGTPSYMAPEQASGNKDTGPACDVYSLGAILYECLTGRPPFKAATLMETLRQVVHDEPVPPSQLQSRTPRDLETIALKCLHKEAGKRYASAGELAEDLRRFLEGRPILARPVGQLERGWRWCRRNPALAAALAAVLVVSVIGTTVSGLLGVQAHEEARQAVAARNEMASLNDQLMTNMARSWLRSLAVQVRPNQPLPALSDPEVETLWEVASTPQDRLRERFLEEALRGPVTTRQLRHRAAFALQAAVALSPQRRAYAEQLLGERLRAEGTSPQDQRDAAMILAQLGIEEKALAHEAADILSQAFQANTDPYDFDPLAQGLAALSPSLEPKQAATLLALVISKMPRSTISPALRSLSLRLEPGEAGEVAAILVDALATNSEPTALSQLGEGLAAVAPRMEAGAARKSAAVLEQALSRRANRADAFWTGPTLAEALLALAARMERKEAAVLLARAICAQAGGEASRPLEKGLLELAARLRPDEGKEAAAIFLQAMSKQVPPRRLQPPARGADMEIDGDWEDKLPPMPGPFESGPLLPLARWLAVLASRLPPEEAARVSLQAVALLARALSEQTDPEAVQTLAQALLVVASRRTPRDLRKTAAHLSRILEPDPGLDDFDELNEEPGEDRPAGSAPLHARVAKEAAAALLQALRKNPNPASQGTLAQALATLLTGLEPAEAAGIAGQAVPLLGEAMSKQRDYDLLQKLKSALVALAPHLGAKAAGESASVLFQMLSKPDHPGPVGEMTEALAALASRMEPGEAARLSAEMTSFLTEAIRKQTHPLALSQLAISLRASAAHLGPKEARQAAAVLMQALDRQTNPVAQAALARGLAALAPRMGEKEAAEASARAVAILAQTLSKGADPNTLYLPAQALIELSPHLGPKAAREAADVLTEALARTKPSQGLWYHPLRPLRALSSRLGPAEAGALSARVASLLNGAMSQAASVHELQPLALLAVETRLEPRDAALVSAKAAVLLAEALGKDRHDHDGPELLTKGLTAVSPRLEPTAARQTAAILVEAIRKNTASDPNSLSFLLPALSALAGRLEPQAVQEAAAVLAQLLNQNPNTLASVYWPEGLLRLAPHLEPKAAQETGAVLVQAMAKNSAANVLQPLTRALVALTARMEPKEAALLSDQVVLLLVRAIGKQAEPQTLSQLTEAVAALSPRLGSGAAQKAAAALAEMMRQESRPNALGPLGQALAAVAPRLEPTAAQQTTAALIPVIRTTGNADALAALAPPLAALAVRLEPTEAQQAAAVLIQAQSKVNESYYLPQLTQAVQEILSGEPFAMVRSRHSALAGTVSSAPGQPLTALALLTVLTPLPPPLPAQVLVDLLKHPFCVGPSRRLVLDQLERHYRRPFADQWDFVRFAEEQSLDLDLTSPPQRAPTQAIPPTTEARK